MTKIVNIIVLLIISISLNAKDTDKLVWPAKPDEPRIEYITSVIKSKNLGIEQGFFSKIYDFFLGEEERVLSAPFGIHSDETRVYLTDVSYKSMYVFDKKEDKVITVIGSDDESFLYPIDVITDNDGNIYVSDSVRSKIYVFEEDGDYKYTIKPLILQRPVGLAINNELKRLYIVDALACQIHVTSLKGKYIKSIGTKGSGFAQFNRPTFIDISKDGKLYVSDSMNHRIQVLDRDGRYLHSFGKLSKYIGGFGSPRGVALDSDENVYVSDTMYNIIQVFNKNGELLMAFGSYGLRAGEFALPEDISINMNNEMYITDTNNKRVQLFNLLNKTSTGSLK